MIAAYQNILSPIGDTGAKSRSSTSRPRAFGARPVIGLLDNSKPNVALFVQALERQLRERDTLYELITVAKPRSAMPCPDLDALAQRCDYVINAVAD